MLPILLKLFVLLLFVAGAFGLAARGAGASRALVAGLRVALFVAVAASAALVVEYKNAGDPAFCGVASGCFAVRVSPFTRSLGVPLPNVGLAAFTALLAASLVAREPAHHRGVAALAAFGGAMAAALLAIQAFVIGAFCEWCVAVDVAAIVAAVAAALVARRAGRAAPGALATGPLGAAAWGVAALAAIGLPFVWGRYPVIPPLPPEIAALQAPAGAGAGAGARPITLVGFTDFECPFCRGLHPAVEAAKAELGDRLRIVRKMVPLPGHPGALPAAKAYLCAPEAQRDRAAGLLYDAPPEQLTDAGVLDVLGPLELDPPAFAACFSAASTQATIDADTALFERLQGRGLPFQYVGRRVVMGNNPVQLRAALESELAGEQPSLPVAYLLAALGLLAAAAAAISLRSRPRPTEPDAPPPTADDV